MTDRKNVETAEEEYEEEREPTPYENQYRQSLNDPDDDEIEDPVDMVTPKSVKKGLASRKDDNVSDTHDYKKRYGDLKKHYDTKLNEWKQQQELLEAKLQMVEKTSTLPELPKSEEELTEFREKYPDVYDVVETISALKASDKVKEIESKLDDLKVKEQEAIVQTAEQELISMHPDFVNLKEDDTFLGWLDDQPPNISDGIYKNNTDSQWAARVIDLYKIDAGITTKKSDSKKSAATAINTRSKASPTADESSNYIRESQVDKMSDKEYAKNQEAIMEAMRTGKFVYDLSGAAR